MLLRNTRRAKKHAKCLPFVTLQSEDIGSISCAVLFHREDKRPEGNSKTFIAVTSELRSKGSKKDAELFLRCVPNMYSKCIGNILHS